jgi:RES domain
MHSVSEVPPLPPANLHDRALPMTDGIVGPLWRIHRLVHDPFFFGPPSGVPPTGRWDAPSGQFGVCYLAVGDPRIAFAETLLRGPDTVVSEQALAERGLAHFEVAAPLRLVMMHGPGLAAMGATSAVSSGPHEFSREWSLALYRHPQQPDGIVYRTRHDDDGLGIALFDRAGARIRFDSSRPLIDPELTDELSRWLNLYNAALN